MKVTKLLLSTLICSGMLLAGCDKPIPTPEPGPGPTPTPQPTEIAVTGVTTTEDAFELEIGETHDLVYTIAPEDATNKNVTVSSNDAAITVSGTTITGALAGDATVTLTTEDGGFTLTYNVTVLAPQAVMPVDDVVDFYAKWFVDDVTIPAYVAADRDVVYETDDSYIGYFDIYIYNSNTEEMNDYKDILVEAGWEIAGESEGDYLLELAEKGITVGLYDYTMFDDDPYINLSFGIAEPEGPSFPVRDVMEFFDTFFGMTIDPFPGYEYANEEINFALVTSQLSYGILEVRITNTDADEEYTWVEALEANEWEITDGDYAGDYVAKKIYGDKFAVLDIQDWLNYSFKAVRVMIYATDAPMYEFPTERINADLTTMGVTATLPEFTGDALYYSYSEDYHQLGIYVEVGTEQDAIATYQADLLAAEFTEAGLDSYGDMHYLAPTEDLDVCVWDGNDVDSPGIIIVDLQKYVAPSTTFPFDEVNAFLTTYDLGFSLDAETLVFPEATYTVSEGTASGYHRLVVEIGSEVADDIIAILEPILTDAGYTKGENSGTTYFYNAAYHEIDISQGNGITNLVFWE